MEHYPYNPAERRPNRSASPQFPNDWEGNTMEVRNTHDGRIEFRITLFDWPCSTFDCIVPLDEAENQRLVYKTQWQRRHWISEKVQIELDLFTGGMFEDDGFLRQLRQLVQLSHDMLMGELRLHCLKCWPHEAALGPDYRRWMVGGE
ncbi:uncharacterized protein FFUJ_12579 [Fusarium fujikuroi IMI 58289]|uniref:Uncharacterized protein n=1 Tax=Gibberella fujikuroi (strain CBS 195.34 / IMI 58289 / NRRL A-6831) TaxID=1279085 RepID=S0EJX0_GIBF5|nr:uncharacterized protein FFUJ_12579 [Fusarium fujikuroi IMI 58289]KLP21323.1 uncharacterized protein LW94_3289 [Fusarium fujikuroi]CCT72688.1 uncharacterized protein FFUJ_12579 [Fusarium fujikuroi IMI 58289]SCO22605.1 uncharacterized protein FFM5_13042 [Fusarium fujikuroi]SCO54489.1 uncharacterized protein FFMR_11834 [Fusarium fujikuroi]